MFRLWAQETWIWQKIMEVSFLLAGNGHLMYIQATFIQFITCYFSLMESSVNHPWSTLLDTSTCTLVVNYWCYALPVQPHIQDLKWQVAMMIKGRVLSYLLKTWKWIRHVCTYLRRGVWKCILSYNKKKVIWEVDGFELRTCFHKSRLNRWQQSFTQPQSIPRILPGDAIRSRKQGEKLPKKNIVQH